MATPNVIRQSLGDTTRSQPVRRSRQQRPPVDIDAAYDVCEQITRAQARHLYSALEPLPAYRRRALCAIHAFARRVDDTAEGNLRDAEKLRLLADARAGIPRDAHGTANRPRVGGAPRCQPTVSDTAHQPR